MPIYEYKCTKCESHFEKMQKVSEEKLKVCDSCGGALEKQWSLSGFQFKGEGWYVTDYAKKGGNSEEKSEKKDKTEKSSGSDSTETPKAASKEKSESTPAAAKETTVKKD